MSDEACHDDSASPPDEKYSYTWHSEVPLPQHTPRRKED